MKEAPTDFEILSHPAYPRNVWFRIGYDVRGDARKTVGIFQALMTARVIKRLNQNSADLADSYRVVWEQMTGGASIYVSYTVRYPGFNEDYLVKQIRRAQRAIIWLFKSQGKAMRAEQLHFYTCGANYEHNACLRIAKPLSPDEENGPIYQAIQKRFMEGYYDPYNNEVMP